MSFAKWIKRSFSKPTEPEPTSPNNTESSGELHDSKTKRRTHRKSLSSKKEHKEEQQPNTEDPFHTESKPPLSKRKQKRKTEKKRKGKKEKRRRSKRKSKKVSPPLQPQHEQQDASPPPQDDPFSWSSEEDDDDLLIKQSQEEEDEELEGLVFEDDFISNDQDDFVVLSPQKIAEEQEALISDVAELLQVPKETARNLLHHFNWKKETLLQKYFDDRKAVLLATGSTPPGKHRKSKRKERLNDGSAVAREKLKGGMCLICGEEKKAEECTSLNCLHLFCNECWRSYLEMKIQEREIKLHCPASDCNLFLGENVIKKLVSPAIFTRFKSFLTESFVEDNRHVSWCPRPNCGHAITSDMIRDREVKCDCGFRFCFNCHHEAHAPATCAQVRDWLSKCQDDSETLHWIGANTKPCPRCTIPVEKNGGCNHMTCRQCSYEWCWLCLRAWKGHNDYYSCNRFEKAQKKKEKKKKKGKKYRLHREEIEREEQRIQLERYLHYYERYVTYSNAAKLEKETREKAYKKMMALTSEASTLAEVKFIEKGTEMLLACQNVLKWSFVYAYYLPEEGAEKNLFNFLQEELEKTTESLAETLEAPGVLLERVKAVTLTKSAATRIENLLGLGN